MIDEIRLHLSARRPGGHDDSDPAIAEAIAKAAADPQLAAWAESEKRSDAALADKLRQLQPPPGLRDTILAGARVGRRRWWHWFNASAWRNFRNSELLALAAILLLILSAVGWNYFHGVKPDTNWQAFATSQIAGIESEAIQLPKVVENVPQDESMPQIQRWLTAQASPLPSLNLPPVLCELRPHGCTKVMWNGEPMSIVCYHAPSGKIVHLVTISKRNLPAPPPEHAPVYSSIDGYRTASWSDGDRSMMLLGKVDESEIRQIMGAIASAVRGAAQGRRTLFAVN